MIASQVNSYFGKSQYRSIKRHTQTFLIHRLDVNAFALHVLEVVEDIKGAGGQQSNTLGFVKLDLSNTQHKVFLLLLSKAFRKFVFVALTDVYHFLHLPKDIMHRFYLFRGGRSAADGTFDW